jgi:hypothetical protein
MWKLLQNYVFRIHNEFEVDDVSKRRDLQSTLFNSPEEDNQKVLHFALLSQNVFRTPHTQKVQTNMQSLIYIGKKTRES